MYENEVEEKEVRMKHAAPLTAFQKKLFDIVKGAYEHDSAEKAYTKVNEERHYHLIQDLEIEEDNEADGKEGDQVITEDEKIEENDIEVTMTLKSKIRDHMQFIFPFGMLFNITWIHLLSHSIDFSKEVKMMLSSMEVMMILLLVGTYLYLGVLGLEEKIKTHQIDEPMDEGL